MINSVKELEDTIKDMQTKYNCRILTDKSIGELEAYKNVLELVKKINGLNVDVKSFCNFIPECPYQDDIGNKCLSKNPCKWKQTNKSVCDCVIPSTDFNRIVCFKCNLPLAIIDCSTCKHKAESKYSGPCYGCRDNDGYDHYESECK